MTPTPTPPAPSTCPSRRQAVALCALLTFGCAVVRAPASGIAPRIPVRDGVAEPQLELWLESGGPVSPPEAEAAAAEARAVLLQVLAPRRLEEGDQLLVVRAQGVSRTGSRRSNQHAAIAGMVVGVVVVAVVAIAASKGGGGRGSGPSVARAAPRPGVPRASPTPPRPPRVGPRAVPIPGPGHGPHHHGGGGVSVAVGVLVPIVPPPPPPSQATTTIWHGTPPPGEGPGSPPDSPPASPEEALAPQPAPIAELLLPPLPPLDLESRGFFTGDQVRVELWLVDRQSGAPLWVKTAEEGTDPRDAEAMKALLDRALDEPGGWSMAGP